MILKCPIIRNRNVTKILLFLVFQITNFFDFAEFILFRRFVRAFDCTAGFILFRRYVRAFDCTAGLQRFESYPF